jgi:hypothetical protein
VKRELAGESVVPPTHTNRHHRKEMAPALLALAITIAYLAVVLT